MPTPPRPVKSRASSSSQRGPTGSDGSAGLRSASSTRWSNLCEPPSPTSSAISTNAQTAAEARPKSARRQGARIIAALCLCLLAPLAAGQQADRPNAVLLVAKPELDDPNFARSVVLVTQADSGETVGVILNRPSERTYPRTGEVLFAGGPVMRDVVLVLFRSAEAP